LNNLVTSFSLLSEHVSHAAQVEGPDSNKSIDFRIARPATTQVHFDKPQIGSEVKKPAFDRPAVVARWIDVNAGNPKSLNLGASDQLGNRWRMPASEDVSVDPSVGRVRGIGRDDRVNDGISARLEQRVDFFEECRVAAKAHMFNHPHDGDSVVVTFIVMI